MLHIGFNVQDHPQNPMYFPPMYVPRIPAMLIQIITIVFLRHAFDLYSNALLVPSVALLMSSSAFPTFFPKDKNNAIVQYFEKFSNYQIRLKNNKLLSDYLRKTYLLYLSLHLGLQSMELYLRTYHEALWSVSPNLRTFCVDSEYHRSFF